MKLPSNHEPERRGFLRLSAYIASGIAAPASITACSRDTDVPMSGSQQTFVQPPTLEARDGLLDVTLVASYLDTTLSGRDPGKQAPVTLRAYAYDDRGPGCSGPTLIVRGGDLLRIRLVNNLPVNPPFASFRDPTNYINPNSTNLHTHGLHVSPGINTGRTPFEFGDFVVDPAGRGVQPRGGSRQYVYQIPKEHPEGPYYYHPQYHGSSAIQSASLMSGVIMVRGPVDDLPEMAQARELIFLFQAPYFASDSTRNNHGAPSGSLEKFPQIAINPTGHGLDGPDAHYLNAQPVLINGVRRPTIVMQSGEVQRWRFVNSQVFNYLNLSLDSHTLHEYTKDGWGRAAYREYPDCLKNGCDGIVLAPGNRSSVLIKAEGAGTYALRSLPFKMAQGKATAFLPGDILAYITVVDTKKTMELPPTPLPVSRFLEPITDQELAGAGGRKRSIIFNMLGNELRPAARTQQSAVSDAVDRVANVASGLRSLLSRTIRLAGDGASGETGRFEDRGSAAPASAIPGQQYQLQPANVMVQNVVLDAVEEWTVFNFNDIAHAFHIHVNPMFIIKVNGAAVDPYWCDTVDLPAGGSPEMPTSVTFRMRFADFVGQYILHNQMLQYSDLGMVQRVSVTPA